MTHEIKAVMFDAGTVLMDFDKMLACRRVSRFCLFRHVKNPMEKDVAKQDIFYEPRAKSHKIYHDLFDNEAENKRSRGQTTGEELFHFCQKKYFMSLELVNEKLFRALWGDIFKENRSIRAAVHKTREAGLPIFVLSNAEEYHWPYVAELAKQAGIPEQNSLVSFMTGTRKPEKAYWEQAIDLAGCPPEKILYIGDDANFVEAFGKFGVNTMLYLPHHSAGWTKRYCELLGS